MRVVVTGGAGYIGSTLVPMLLADGHQVHVVDSLLFGGQALLSHFIHPDFSLARVDVRDREALAPELAGADVVIHLAALVGYPLCKKLPQEAKEVNLDGTRNVAELAPSDTLLVYSSTGSNYGEVEGVCTEDTPLNPLSLYGETKTQGEQICRDRGNSVSLRFATAYGIAPRMRLDLMINDFTWQALHRRYLVVYEKHFRRTFIHVRDIARAFCHVLAHREGIIHDVYNVGHESLNYTKEDIVRMLEERVKFMVYFAEFGKDEDRRDYEVDYSRIRSSGFEISVSIEQGLSELVRGLPLLPLANPFSNV
jgi:nucleoside-diphosphate-sugar epimerase